jgi:hypothetical protein
LQTEKSFQDLVFCDFSTTTHHIFFYEAFITLFHITHHTAFPYNVSDQNKIMATESWLEFMGTMERELLLFVPDGVDPYSPANQEILDDIVSVSFTQTGIQERPGYCTCPGCPNRIQSQDHPGICQVHAKEYYDKSFKDSDPALWAIIKDLNYGFGADDDVVHEKLYGCIFPLLSRLHEFLLEITSRLSNNPDLTLAVIQLTKGVSLMRSLLNEYEARFNSGLELLVTLLSIFYVEIFQLVSIVAPSPLLIEATTGFVGAMKSTAMSAIRPLSSRIMKLSFETAKYMLSGVVEAMKIVMIYVGAAFAGFAVGLVISCFLPTAIGITAGLATIGMGLIGLALLPAEAPVLLVAGTVAATAMGFGLVVGAVGGYFNVFPNWSTPPKTAEMKIEFKDESSTQDQKKK